MAGYDIDVPVGVTHTKSGAMALLSIEERNAMAATAQLNGLMKRIIGRGPTGEQDLSEFVIHLHAIQNMILAQAAARAYPDTYRLLGERLL